MKRAVIPKVTQIPKIKFDVTPDVFRKSGFQAKSDREALKRHVQQYIMSLHYIHLRRIFYITADGQIVEMDANNFFRNKKFLDEVQMLTLRIKDRPYILRIGWLIVDFNYENEHLEVQLWKPAVPYLSFALRVLARLAEQLHKPVLKVLFVEKFDGETPIGEVKLLTGDEIEESYVHHVGVPLLTHQIFQDVH